MTFSQKIEIATRLTRILRLAKTLQKKMEVAGTNRNIQGLLASATDSLNFTYMEYEDKVLTRDEAARNVYRLLKEYV